MLSHLRFVVHIARGYTGYGLPLGDLIQEGNVGLMKAVKRFDPDMGVRLVSFAVHWIRAEIHEYVLRNWRLVKIATTKAQRKLFFNLRRLKKHLGWLNAEEVQASRRDLGVTAGGSGARWSSGSPARTWPSTRAGSATTRTASRPAHYLTAPDADPADASRAGRLASNVATGLHAALAELDARSRDILEARWLADEEGHAAGSGRAIRRVRRAHPPDREFGHRAPAAPAAGAGASRHCLKYATGVARCARHPAVRCGKYRVQADDSLWFSKSFEFMIQPNSLRLSVAAKIGHQSIAESLAVPRGHG